MKAILKVVAGAKPTTIRLKLPTVIGRSESAAVKVRHALVSRQHCEIYEEEGWLVVHDLGSSNGTFVDDARIDEPTFLYPGERLRVGGVIFEAAYQTAEPSGSATGAAHERAGGQAGNRDVTATDASSVIHYREEEQGSFLGIEESPSEETVKPSRISIDTGHSRPADPSQSGLRKFFDQL